MLKSCKALITDIVASVSNDSSKLTEISLINTGTAI